MSSRDTMIQIMKTGGAKATLPDDFDQMSAAEKRRALVEATDERITAHNERSKQDAAAYDKLLQERARELRAANPGKYRYQGDPLEDAKREFAQDLARVHRDKRRAANEEAQREAGANDRARAAQAEALIRSRASGATQPGDGPVGEDGAPLRRNPVAERLRRGDK